MQIAAKEFGAVRAAVNPGQVALAEQATEPMSGHS